jgi:predicted ABC-type ATPase
LSQHKPALFIIAGPVGAGKTTFYEAYLKEAFPTLVPAVREQQQPFLNERRSFAVEDIRVDTQLLDEAKATGYTTKVLFISTEDANLNVGRVLVRVRRGGEAEAISTVIDSYREATKDLAEVRKHADELILYDNTAHDRGFRVVAHFTGGELSKVAQTIPDWAAKVFGRELNAPRQRAKPGHGR